VSSASDHAVEFVVSAIVRRDRRAAGVWLFGSEVRDAATSTSDIDVAVLCTPPLGLERAAVADEASAAAGREIDVVDLATCAATLAWEVVTTGRLVVEQDELAVEDFVRKARYAAEDEEQRNRMAVLGQSTGVATEVR
jgi:predicted nucleotidyltransferase